MPSCLSLLLVLALLALASSQPPTPGGAPEMPSGGPGGPGGDSFQTQQAGPPQGGAAGRGGSPFGQGGLGGFPGPVPVGPGQGAGAWGLPTFPPAAASGAAAGAGGAAAAAGGAAAGGATNANAGGGAFSVAPQVFSPDVIAGLQNQYAQRMGYSPLLNAGLTSQMMQQAAMVGQMQQPQPQQQPVQQQQQQPIPFQQGQQQRFPQQQMPAGNPMAGAAPAAAMPFGQPQFQTQQMSPLQQQYYAQQPAAQYPPQYQQQYAYQPQVAPRMQPYQVQAGTPYTIPAAGYQPTASPQAIAAANTGFNNLLVGLGQGMTNAGRNMAAGPPPAPVQGFVAGYGGATVHGTYPGIGTVDLGVPRVGPGGASATLNPAMDTAAMQPNAVNQPAVLPMQTEVMPPITEAANAAA